MPKYTIRLDRDAPSEAGKSGLFRVDTIYDTDGNEITAGLIDIGTQFSSMEDLRQAIAKRTGYPVTKIDLVDAD